jgi:DNA (cytosine-5)-methyltransferase 1
MKFRLLDVFSGIGGFSLGFQRAGERLGVEIEIVAFCESDPAARKVLKKHWGTRKIFLDIKNLTCDLKNDGLIGERTELTEPIDIMVGGFP